jgi:hypothetical protein
VAARLGSLGLVNPKSAPDSCPNEPQARKSHQYVAQRAEQLARPGCNFPQCPMPASLSGGSQFVQRKPHSTRLLALPGPPRSLAPVAALVLHFKTHLRPGPLPVTQAREDKAYIRLFY